MMVFVQIIVFIFALVALIVGSDYFVKGAAAVAEKIGVSEFMIGLTLVAVGTSLPELASSVVAAFNNESGIIIGNIVGSNIANIALIIGVTASMVKIKTEEHMLIRDGYIMIFSTILFYVFITYGRISRVAAFLFLILYIAYIVFLFETRKKTKDEFHFRAFIPYFFKFKYVLAIHRRVMSEISKTRGKKPGTMKALIEQKVQKDLLIMLLGGVGIFFGAKYLIYEAIFFAEHFNLPKTVIGVSLIAFGTSVPELSVSLTAARKGYGSIAVGNIIGSNIANILLVGGVSGLITPLIISRITLIFTAPVMIFTSIFLLIFIKSEWEIHRLEGISFIILYILFLTILFTRISVLGLI